MNQGRSAMFAKEHIKGKGKRENQMNARGKRQKAKGSSIDLNPEKSTRPFYVI